jgi:hypothetical protein
MSGELVIVPCSGNDGYVELARTKTGRLFKKHILSMGDLRHPTTGETIKVDDTFVKTLTKNFRDGACDIVQIPLANENNKHSEDPERNIGEVIDVQVQDQKIYAVLDVRDDKHADKMGKTYLGASAMLSLDYTDTKTGTKVGPTLLHTCVTNRPYVTGLEPYQEIVAATSDTSQGAVLLSTDVIDLRTAEGDPGTANEHDSKETDMADTATIETATAKPSLEEMLTALKTEHGIDVPSLQSQASVADQAAAQAASLSQTLTKALSDAGVISLSSDTAQVSTEDVVSAVAELATTNVSLTDRVHKLERTEAETHVSGLIGEGRVLPAQKAAFVELRLTNPTMFGQLVPAEPIVKLNNETGVTPPDDAAHTQNVDAEIARLSSLMATTPKK